MTELLSPSGRPLVKASSSEGTARAVGLSPWRDVINGRSVQGASSKKGSWKDYYEMYTNHAIVRSAVDKIAKSATSVGLDYVPRDSRAKVKKREVAILQEFFSKQNDFSYELRRIYKDLLIYGDAYLYIVRDRRRRPTRLKRVAPKTIHIKAARNGEILAYYQKDPDNILEEAVRFEPDDILHFRIDDPDNDLYGLSPLESLKNAVASDIYAQLYNGAFFKNSGVTGTIIAVRNANPDEIERNRKWLEANYTGPSAAHKPIVIEGESVDVKKAVTSHSEMGFLEGRRFIMQEILAVLDVPPTKIGVMENANRSNSREQDKTFRVESIAPLQDLIESVLNDKFVRQILKVDNTIIKHREADTRDQIEQMDFYTKGEAWGIYNANEIRAKLGMAPVEGGDINIIMTPTGAVPLDRMNLFFRMPKPNTDEIPTVPEDPIEGEPVPEAVSGDVRPAVSNTAEKHYIPPAISVQGCLFKLENALENASDLRQAYSYAMDALDVPGMDHIAHSLKQACQTNDELLKSGYIERAREAIGRYFQPIDTSAPLAKNDEEEEDE